MKPIAWYDPSNGAVSTDKDSLLFTSLGQVWPLYAKEEWVSLTDKEVSKIIDEEIGFNSCWGPEETFARAIEAALRSKNT